MRAVAFTLDLEDHRPGPEHAVRYPAAVRAVLAFLAARSVRGTVFVVGEVAQQSPDLVREVAAAGHEVGLHGWRHTPLTASGPVALRDELARGRDLLQSLTGQEVGGFRAPTFSLVPDSLWATDVLAEVGFTYSSSVLPARNPLFGFRAAPRTPFRWASGVLELPCPVAGPRAVALPYLGGTYLRVLPGVLVAAARRMAPRGAVLWAYCHPYDFDPGAPYWQVERSRLQSRLLWVNRARMFDKLGRVLAAGATPPLGELVERGLDAPVWAPGAAGARRR